MSNVWKYFIRSEDGKKVKCTIKGCVIEYVHGKSYGNSNMKHHLKNIHDIDVDIMDKQLDDVEKINENDKNKIDKDLVLLVVKENIPLRIVESKYFINYTKSLKNNYKLLNRKQLRENIGCVYQENFDKIFYYINKNDSKFSISTDIWTANTNKSYLGIKLNYINDEFILKSYTIAFKYISGSHSGSNIYTIIIETLKKFNINKIQSYTSDNSSNNINCAKLLNETSDFVGVIFVGCFAHIINIIVQSGMLKNNSLIIKVRNIVNDVNNSTKLNDNLENIAKINSLKYYSLVNDVVTRWNSTYLMLESVIKNESLLKLLSETNRLDDNEWMEIKKIHTLLNPFYELTRIISGSRYPTQQYGGVYVIR